MSRTGGRFAQRVAVLCTALVLFLTAQAPAMAIGVVKHQLGDVHAADPWAGALQLDHKADHDHGAAQKPGYVDPHADYEGPPIEPDPDDRADAGPHHHHSDSQAPTWLMPDLQLTRLEIGAPAIWHAPVMDLAGLAGDSYDHPPKR